MILLLFVFQSSLSLSVWKGWVKYKFIRNFCYYKVPRIKHLNQELKRHWSDNRNFTRSFTETLKTQVNISQYDHGKMIGGWVGKGGIPHSKIKCLNYQETRLNTAENAATWNFSQKIRHFTLSMNYYPQNLLPTTPTPPLKIHHVHNH